MQMVVERSSVLKVLSLLLQYPQKQLTGSLKELDAAIAQLSHLTTQSKFQDFLTYLDSTPLLRLQEMYTRTFDLNPRTCLYLSFHKWGESEERGSALVELSQLYKSAGYELSTRELPDYLPLILEFLSVCSEQACAQIMTDYGAQISDLACRLQQQGSPYAGLLEVLSMLSQEFHRTGA